MGAKCCSCSKGSVKEDSVISVAEHREQGRDLREMETEETRNDTGSSEHESPTSDLRTLEILEKFSSVSVGLQEGTSRIRESPRSLGEDWMPSSNILWSTDSFSGPIPSGYYSVIPDKRLTHFKSFPTSSELRTLGDVGLESDVIYIDLEADKKLLRLKKWALVESKEGNLRMFIKKIARLVADVHPRKTPHSPANTSQSSNSHGYRLLADIKHGTCRSRAILFKVLTDSVGLKSKLVVGFPSDLTEGIDSHNHISVVVVLNNEEMLVDLMRTPGELVPMSTEAIYMAHTSTPWNSACHSPLEPNSPLGGAGQLETKRMRRSPSATPENSDAIARAMRVSNSSNQSRFSKEGDSSPHSSDDITRGESSNQNINDILNEVLGSPTFQNKPLLPYDEWNIDISEVKVGALIGRGCFGKVYRGSWSGTDVAIKVFLEQDLVVEHIKDFCNEISILSRLRHPNVILFLGACTKPPQLSLVTELMENGSLYNKLYSPGEKKEFSWKRKLDMLRDICKGLMCIHRMGIVHRDLKSANCLLSDQGKVKICDFGLSRIMKDMTMKNTEPAGTPEWMAPELIRNEPFSQKCDIFSFGVIMWELCTLTKPWKGVPINRVIHTVANEGARLEIPDGPLCKLIAACWSEPEQRPSCKEILAELTLCEYSL